MKSVRFALNINKTKPPPIAGFPLAKTFNETMIMDLKEWSHYEKIWFLHMIYLIWQNTSYEL